MSSQRLAWVRDDVDELCELGRRDPTAAVPSCPGWTLSDLLAHVAGSFSDWWTHTLTSGPDDEVDAAGYMATHPSPVPEQPSDAVALLADAAVGWLAKAEAVDPAKPTWTFDGPGRADFWFGRASTECAVHLWDARGAFEPGPTVPAERAVDVITETIQGLLPHVLGATDRLGVPLPTSTLGIVADDVDGEWVVTATASGPVTDSGASPDVVIRGPVSDVCLFLHGREAPGVEVTGADQWSAWTPFVQLYSGGGSSS